MKEVIAGIICVVVVGAVCFFGVGHALDKPTPRYNSSGDIVAYDTPQGIVRAGTPEFEKIRGN